MRTIWSFTIEEMQAIAAHCKKSKGEIIQKIGKQIEDAIKEGAVSFDVVGEDEEEEDEEEEWYEGGRPVRFDEKGRPYYGDV